MSFTGAMRSIAAASRRAERDHQRRARLAAQQFKQLQKEQAVVNAAQAVASYNDYISVIQSIHHDANDPVDWTAIQQEPPPKIPSPASDQEHMAQAALDSYQPSFFDKLFKLSPAKILRLEGAVVTARQQDQMLAIDRQNDYNRQCIDWQERQHLAKQVLAKNSDVYSQVLEAFTPFEGISHLGSGLGFTFTSDHIEVDLQVNTAEVIPDFVVTQLASGKLSRKALPISKFNELYQDYVCGCLLRVAREIQAHLPVSQVVVHALVDQFNSSTGLREKQVIVSAAMPRAILSRLNFTALDPSDSMQNFSHTMKFTKSGGFQGVDRVGLAAPLPSTRRH